MPGISIVTPTFNRAWLLERVWSSLRTQTFSDFEWLVIDDGSTDNTQSVLNTLADPRIKYVYQENAGVNSARNTGERHVNADFVLFLDSDDELFDEKTLASMEAELRAAAPEVAAVALTVKVTGEGRVISWVSQPKMLAYYPEIVCDRAARGEFIFLFRRDALALRAWPDVHGEVLKLWAIAKERPMLFINRPGRIYHTSSGDNLTGARSTIRLAPRAVLGLEMLIAEHSAAWLEHCPATYGRYLFNLAFNQALANQEEAAAQSLLDAWRNHGPKLKIAAVGASLLVGSTLRQRLFLSAAQMRRAH